jgi:hypothetical protein
MTRGGGGSWDLQEKGDHLERAITSLSGPHHWQQNWEPLGAKSRPPPIATERLAPDLRPSLTQKLQTPLGVHSQKGIDDGKKVCRYCGGTRKADLRLGIRDFWVN